MTEIDITVETGSVVALPVSSIFDAVLTGLAAVAVVGGGTFAAGTYFWVVTGTDAYGETTASNEATATIALNGSANLSWNPLPPGTTGVKVYRGTVAGAENALIATLGAVTAFTDTGAAGSAATPPTSNTAQVGNQTIWFGRGKLYGYAIRESSGTVKADLSLQVGGQEIVPILIAVGGVDKQWFGPDGIVIPNQLILHVNSGTFKGDVYVKPYY